MNTLYYTPNEYVGATPETGCTPDFGKLSYDKFTWLTGEYDPSNAYPVDDRGKDYVRSVETLGKRGIWFIKAFGKKKHTGFFGGGNAQGKGTEYSVIFFVDNYGNVWAQREDASGKYRCPIKEKTYTHSTNQLTDCDISDIQNEIWCLPEDETKITEHIWRCVAMAEAELEFDMEKCIKRKPEQGAWEILGNRFIVAVGTVMRWNAGCYQTKSENNYCIDNYGQVWGFANYKLTGGKLNDAKFPLLEIQQSVIDCLISCKADGASHAISKILQEQTVELYALESGEASYKVLPPLEGDSSSLNPGRYAIANWARGPIDNHGQAYIKGTLTMLPGSPGSLEFVGDQLNPCAGTFKYPIPTVLQPVVEYVIHHQRTQLCQGSPHDINFRKPDLTLCSRLELLQPIAKWLYDTYAPSALKQDAIAQQRARDLEARRREEAEEARRIEAERLVIEAEDQRVRILAEADAARIASERAAQRAAAEAELVELERAAAEAQRRIDGARARIASLLT